MYLVAYRCSIAYKSSKVLAVQCKEIICEGLIKKCITSQPHILRFGWCEGMPGVADHDMGPLWDVHLSEKHPADLGFPKKQVPAYRQKYFQVLAEGVH